MQIRAFEDEWLVGEDQSEPRASVVLADADPISRRVLGTVLRDAAQLQYICCVDSHRPLEEWPLSQADVVVLSVGPQDDPVPIVRQLASRRIRVLLIGTGWSRYRVDAAFSAGATGCLVKDTEIGRLATATRAVASGHVVMSPQLFGLFTASPRVHGPRAVLAAHRSEARSPERLLRALTEREREVLDLLADGLSTAEVAGALTLSPATVKSHVSHSLSKLGARNRLEAVLMMQQARSMR
ncbi:response regulator transcription factor [Streptomyces triculaminicus]|uniref:Response regulator transcription factor n=2 Tax=Streptomyces TaxID=1883 RepID=A0A939JPA5_9ACTN|nr:MULTISPECIES: response regulator transcription factor [Streptomyces]MBO0652497.1 response regulator transcription factor [Streptomyces triculaminicus]QSY51901.1 response regulator transcription factor [Streptomyces griseocarneus]